MTNLWNVSHSVAMLYFCDDAKRSARAVARIDTGLFAKNHLSPPSLVQQVGTRA